MRLFEPGADALKLAEEGRLLLVRTAEALDRIAAADAERAPGDRPPAVEFVPGDSG